MLSFSSMSSSKSTDLGTPLAPDTLLVRAPDITLRLREDDEVTIDAGGERARAPKISVAVLDAFAKPRSLGSALAELAKSGPEQFIEISSVVVQLARAGILAPPGTQPRARTRGYVKPSIHIAMLDDDARTTKFCAALRATVTSSSVVVDIGTGTGVLATCAALAGAKRVYAIESTGIADVAERMFAANGIAERTEMIRERSTQATLPERGDVLVTEMIGNDPLDEHLLEVVADAQRRLLVPGARIIPSAIELVAVPIDTSAETLRRHAFTNASVARYSEKYGMTFEPLLQHKLGATQPIMIKTAEACAAPLVATPLSLATIDLERPIAPVFRAGATFELTSDVTHLGVFLAFRATLSPGNVLSTVPGEVETSNHWRYALWLAEGTGPLTRGQSVVLDYAYERGTSALRLECPA